MAVTDRDAAARFGVDPPRDHDSRPRYDGRDALFPKGWDAMDADRHNVPCSGEWSPTRSAWGWWKATCLDCGYVARGTTGKTFREDKAEHLA